MLEKEEMKA